MRIMHVALKSRTEIVALSVPIPLRQLHIISFGSSHETAGPLQECVVGRQ